MIEKILKNNLDLNQISLLNEKIQDSFEQIIYKSISNINFSNFKRRFSPKILDDLTSISKNYKLQLTSRTCFIGLSTSINTSNFLKDYTFKTKNIVNHILYFIMKDGSMFDINGLKVLGFTKFTSRLIFDEYLTLNIMNYDEINNLLSMLERSSYHIKSEEFTIDRSINSCGIILFEGLNRISFADRIFLININGYRVYLKFENIDLFLYFLNMFIRYEISNTFQNSSIIIFSTNLDSNPKFNYIESLLSLFKEETLNITETLNTNSNNKIVTYIIDHQKFITKKF